MKAIIYSRTFRPIRSLFAAQTKTSTAAGILIRLQRLAHGQARHCIMIPPEHVQRHYTRRGPYGTIVFSRRRLAAVAPLCRSRRGGADKTNVRVRSSPGCKTKQGCEIKLVRVFVLLLLSPNPVRSPPTRLHYPPSRTISRRRRRLGIRARRYPRLLINPSRSVGDHATHRTTGPPRSNNRKQNNMAWPSDLGLPHSSIYPIKYFSFSRQSHNFVVGRTC